MLGGGMLGGGPRERGEGLSPETQQQMVIRNGEPSVTPQNEEGSAARSASWQGPAAPQAGSPATRQVPSSTCLAAAEKSSASPKHQTSAT